MPKPLLRETPPAKLPSGCKTFADQVALDAHKAHWAGVVAKMPPADVVKWIIGTAKPSPAVIAEVAKQKDCMFEGMKASSGVTLPKTKQTQWTESELRDFNAQQTIWTEKFKFIRKKPFDRISQNAVKKCSRLLNSTEVGQKWDTSNSRHKTCWSLLPDDEKQQEILAASSAPGISRHHWGTDIDFFSVEPADFLKGGQFSDEYAWMMSNASAYGFVQTYTATSAFMGLGYMEERWHWSYWPISQALLEFARNHQSTIQAALTTKWGGASQYSFISKHWKDYMFNVNETPWF
jgi:LAS superfamily LD-carboxypeptidase LdcB